MRERAEDENDSLGVAPCAGAPDEALVGGRYRIESLLGRGGMGAVYCATDSATGDRVALKRMLISGEDHRSARAVAQFEREYHTLIDLAHPSIIAVHDYGIDAHGPYYTMELLEGQDLRTVAPLPWPRVCSILRDLASSLAMFHSRRLVHRDVTTRNVRLSADGRAKLIDFGTMVPMGVAKEVVGTPPFMAPETVQQQSLDGRADIYSLGALAYCMLTGRQAYPAKRIDQLRDYWRTTPAAPHRLVEGIPSALAELVMAMLSMDRGLRPGSASAVMERVTALADLPPEEQASVPRAYLTTPTLVGRGAQLVDVRCAVIEALRGAGAAFLIEGEPGTGRSRFLDACVLEGKLVGATVLRADATDGARGQCGATRAMLAQLVRAMPEAECRLGAARNLVAPLLPSDKRSSLEDPAAFATAMQAAQAAGRPSGREMFAAVEGWLRGIARERLLLVAIDDLDLLDEPSAALFASLASDMRGHRLVLVATTSDASGAGRDATGLVRELARRVTLPALCRDEVHSLLGSVFGDVRNLSVVSERIHALSAGNPRACMRLAQYFVDVGIARYGAGHWQLPAMLSAADQPISTAEALGARVAQLSPEARALAEPFSLLLGEPVHVDRIAMLAGDQERAAVFRALDELVAAQMLSGADQRYCLRDQDLAHTLSAQIPLDQKPALHRRLAKLLKAQADDGLRVAEHQFLAGDEVDGIATLLCWLDLRIPWSARRFERYHWLLKTALEACQALGRPVRERTLLELALVRSSISLKVPDVHVYAKPLVERLSRCSGLEDWQELPDVSDPAERLRLAFEAATARHAASPAPDDEVSPMEAIGWLAEAVRQIATTAPAIFDVELLALLPSLRPFEPLSPAIPLIEHVIETAQHVIAGRIDDALTAVYKVVERLDQPDHAGLDEDVWRDVRNNAVFGVAVLEGTLGMETAFQWADELEAWPMHEVNAWQVRMNTYLRLGDEGAAQACRRKAELLSLQERPAQSLDGTIVLAEFEHYARNRDVLGVKGTLRPISDMAEVHPGWIPFRELSEASYELVRGNPQLAEAILSHLLSGLEPGRHTVWATAAATHINALLELRRCEEAARMASQYQEQAVAVGLRASDARLQQALAVSLATLGRREALDIIDGVVEHLEASRVRGLAWLTAYLSGVSVACELKDRVAFDRYAHKAVRILRASNTSSSGALYQRVREAARRAQFELDDRFSMADEAQLRQERQVAEMLKTMLDDLSSPAERAAHALPLLVSSCRAHGGVIFRATPQGPDPWTSYRVSDQELAEAQAVAQEYFESVQREGELTASTAETGESFGAGVSSTVTGAAYHAVALHASASPTEVPAGLVILTTDKDDALCVHWQTVWAVGQALFGQPG